MKKYFKIFVFVFFTIVMFPKNVFAEDISVKAVTNPSNPSANTLATIVAEKNVTTVAQLKQALSSQNINLDNYLVLNSMYSLASDSEVVCGSTLSCYGPIDNLTTNLYLMPINHTERKFTLNSIPATNENMFESLVQANYDLFDSLSFKSCNDSYTTCTFTDMMNFTAFDNVVIEYNYDKDIKIIAQAVVNAGLLNNTDFVATDVELLNFINYGGSLADYTSAFKEQLSNLNFRFEMDQRGGAFEPFNTAAIGFYKFLYNDTLYAIKDFMSINAPHIIYVPSDTTNVKSAIEARLQTLFADDLVLTVDESDDTVNELLTSYGENTISGGDVKYYILTVNDPDSYRDGQEFFFMAEKDSSKVNNNVSFKSSDLVTSVSVSTDENIPLDTLIDVTHITSGDEYNNIISALDIEDGEVFDINLFSNAQDRRITRLENGKFLVSIPVPEKYEGKALIIYYVDSEDNNKVTEYNVVVKDGYATFETDHFSIYTLTINPNQTSNTTSDGNGTSTSENGSSSNNSSSSNSASSDALSIPKTGDHILMYVVLLGLSFVGFIFVKKNSKKNN